MFSEVEPRMDGRATRWIAAPTDREARVNRVSQLRSKSWTRRQPLLATGQPTHSWTVYQIIWAQDEYDTQVRIGRRSRWPTSIPTLRGRRSFLSSIVLTTTGSDDFFAPSPQVLRLDEHDSFLLDDDPDPFARLSSSINSSPEYHMHTRTHPLSAVAASQS